LFLTLGLSADPASVRILDRRDVDVEFKRTSNAPDAQDGLRERHPAERPFLAEFDLLLSSYPGE
jgi:hypothetical protein